MSPNTRFSPAVIDTMIPEAVWSDARDSFIPTVETLLIGRSPMSKRYLEILMVWIPTFKSPHLRHVKREVGTTIFCLSNPKRGIHACTSQSFVSFIFPLMSISSYPVTQICRFEALPLRNYRKWIKIAYLQ